jgi:hypothetical protein
VKYKLTIEHEDKWVLENIEEILIKMKNISNYSHELLVGDIAEVE